jgi:hypothetical protein
MTDPALELLGHMKQHYFGRVYAASPEGLLVLALAAVAIVIGVRLASRRSERKRSQRQVRQLGH